MACEFKQRDHAQDVATPSPVDAATPSPLDGIPKVDLPVSVGRAWLAAEQYLTLATSRTPHSCVGAGGS